MSRLLVRLAWTATIVLVAAGLALQSAYRYDRAMLARLAEVLDAGQDPSPEQRLVRYVAYSHQEVRVLRGPEDIRSGLVRLWYRFNPLHPGPGDVLRWGGDYRGSCGSQSSVVVAMLQSRGVPSRHLMLFDPGGRSIHDVVEASIGGRWVVADPQFGLVFRRPDGQLATARDLATDKRILRAFTDSIPRYAGLYTYDSTANMNWRKVPVVLPALRAVLVRTIGPERVRDMVRPGLWMWPKAFYSVVCFTLAGLSALLALVLGRRGRRKAQAVSAGPATAASGVGRARGGGS